MGAIEGRSAGTRVAGLDLARLYRWAAMATALLVFVQALLAGRGWFVDFDLIEVHGWVGNATFLVVVGQAALAFAAYGRRALGRLELGLSALLVVLVVAQIGMGYAGRESGGAAAWHVPTGVLIFGVSSALLALGLTRPGSPPA